MGSLVQTSPKMLKQGGAELVICYFCAFTFSEKKKPQEKRDLSFKNGNAKLLLCDYRRSFLLCYFTQ